MFKRYLELILRRNGTTGHDPSYRTILRVLAFVVALGQFELEARPASIVYDCPGAELQAIVVDDGYWHVYDTNGVLIRTLGRFYGDGHAFDPASRRMYYADGTTLVYAEYNQATDNFDLPITLYTHPGSEVINGGTFVIDLNRYYFTTGDNDNKIHYYAIGSGAVDSINILGPPGLIHGDLAYNMQTKLLYGGTLNGVSYSLDPLNPMGTYNELATSNISTGLIIGVDGDAFVSSANTSPKRFGRFNLETGAFTPLSALNGNASDATAFYCQTPNLPEICGNGIDDDGNGLTDGEDPACFAACKIVTNTQDAGFGSLRQAILCANDRPGLDTIVFNIETSDPGYDVARGVFRIEMSTALPIVTDALLIDGSTQTVYTGNTNTSVLGTSTTVGVDAIPIAAVQGPEIEVFGAETIDGALHIQADNSTVRGLSIYGFKSALIFISGSPTDPVSDVTVTDCALGIQAHSGTLPPDASTATDQGASGLFITRSNATIIRNNVIAHCNAHGVEVYGGRVTNSIIDGNHIYSNGRVLVNRDGIGLTVPGISNTTVSNNYIFDNNGSGYDCYDCRSTQTVINNTIVRNGFGRRSDGSVSETAGVRMFRVDSNYILRNIIADNYGAGIMVEFQGTSNTLSQNAIYNNGNTAHPLDGVVTGQIGIDLHPMTNGSGTGIAPYITLNDEADADTGPNTVLNFPVIELAVLKDGNLEIEGFAPPGAIIELFVADSDANNIIGSTTFGEGRSYLLSFTEGGTASGATHPLLPGTVVDPYVDEDATTGSYTGDFGANSNAQRFGFVIPASQVGSLSPGSLLTATATGTPSTETSYPEALGSTSEFSNVVPVSEPEICDNGIDDDGDGSIDCEDGDCGLASVAAGGDRTVCPGVETILRASSGAPHGPHTFQWTGSPIPGPKYTIRPTATTEYTVTLTNANGCTATDTVVVGMRDSVPTFTAVPADTSVACEAPLPTATASATTCSGDPAAITQRDSIVSGCGSSSTVYRIFTATDPDAGTRTEATQEIVRVDSSAPTFPDAPTDVSLSCGEAAPAPNVTASDNCDPDVDVTHSDATTPGCAGDDITRTYTATDDCGNTATFVQTITFSDGEPPTFTNPVDTIVLACGDAVPVASISVSDNCDADVVVTNTDRAEPNCSAPTTIRTYVATDNCGNSRQFVQYIITEDTEPPVFTQTPGDIELNCGDTIPLGGIQVADACSDSIDVTFTDITEPGCVVPSILRSYVATDGCGNRSTYTHRIDFVDDEPPTFLEAPEDMTVGPGQIVPDRRPLSATDNCSDSLVVQPIDARTDVDSFNYRIVRTWTAVDQCGNLQTHEQIITVETDRPYPIPYSGFSPNGDDVNETFTVKYIDWWPNSHIRVFNRWGNKVYDNQDYTNNWDGSWEGCMLPSGTYYYVLSLTDGSKLSGYMQLMR